MITLSQEYSSRELNPKKDFELRVQPLRSSSIGNMEHTDQNEQSKLKPLHKRRHAAPEHPLTISTHDSAPTAGQSSSIVSASDTRQQHIRRDKTKWTDAEDEKLDKGLAKYGTAWTRISTDPDLGLTHRNRHQVRMRFVRRENWQRQESLSGGSTTEDDPAFVSGTSKDVQAMKSRVRMERELKEAEQQKHQSTKPELFLAGPCTEPMSASSLKRKADFDIRQMPIRKPRVLSTNMQRKLRLERARKEAGKSHRDASSSPFTERTQIHTTMPLNVSPLS